jgi:hypothetical protein
MAGASALAQQPAEWRPNIAEDNKTASLDDTFAFLKGIVTTSENTTLPGAGELFVTQFERGESCSARLVRGFRDGRDELVVDSVELKLSSVDPLLITVHSVNRDNRVPFLVVVEGTNNSQIALGQESTYHNAYHGGAYLDGKSFRELSQATAPCLDGQHKGNPNDGYVMTQFGACWSRPITSYSFGFPFGDQEVAKRFARGLMHAALLCGGTKAVSPF